MAMPIRTSKGRLDLLVRVRQSAGIYPLFTTRTVGSEKVDAPGIGRHYKSADSVILMQAMPTLKAVSCVLGRGLHQHVISLSFILRDPLLDARSPAGTRKRFSCPTFHRKCNGYLRLRQRIRAKRCLPPFFKGRLIASRNVGVDMSVGGQWRRGWWDRLPLPFSLTSFNYSFSTGNQLITIQRWQVRNREKNAVNLCS
jgi:hypothetical protein